MCVHVHSNYHTLGVHINLKYVQLIHWVQLYIRTSSIYIIVRARCESCSKYTTGANAIAPMDALGEEMEDFDEDLENTPPPFDISLES